MLESQKAFCGESLGRLPGGAVDLTGDDVLIGVDIKPMNALSKSVSQKICQLYN